MENFSNYLNLVNEAIAGLDLNREPKNLYQPISYTLSMHGKRLRPVLALAACDLFGGDINKAIDVAVGLEIFHNFTLVHDDIMDEAPLRRGEKTVYKKWDSNVAILSGDTMFSIALRQILASKHPNLFEILSLFTQTAIEVCEGQQLDMDFEDKDEVTIDDYLGMIRLKTAVLLGASLKVGALCAYAGENQTRMIYDFGINAGIAFQLKDDWLDAFGEEEKFGKSIGGDIVANKKTYLYLKCLQMASPADRIRLQNFYGSTPGDENTKVREVLTMYRKYRIKEASVQEMEKFFGRSLALLSQVDASSDKKEALVSFAEKLYKRDR